jgi:diguanylate cyclase (GGDEF)-like protein
MSLREALTPSFRNRLRLFFVVIVIIPMIAVAVVLFQVVVESDQSRTDARLAGAQKVAMEVYDVARADAERAAQVVGEDQQLSNAVDAGERPAIDARLEALTRTTRARYILMNLDAEGRFAAGRLPAVALAQSPLEDDRQQPLGRLTVSVTAPAAYAMEVSKLTGAQVVVSEGDETLHSTLTDATAAALPTRDDAEVAGRTYRVTSFAAPGVGDARVHVRLLFPSRGTPSVWSTEGLVVLGLLLGFLVLAVAFAATVSRTLQYEIQRLLEAAQRLGGGDFSVAVPAEGNDEFAALGKEFNSMARQLEARLEELQRERARLQEAIRRVGESFAKGLDRVGLLEIVVQTAVDGIGAAGGRATMRRSPDEYLREVARSGDPDQFRRALHAAEAAVIDAGEVAEIQVGGAYALAAPLGSTEEGDQVIGIVSVARGDRAFSARERELFAYLTNQASVSVENVDLHETVQRQAVTDELTGLFNHRRFQEVMSIEVERARRYGHEMGLIMLDIDNFKQVNDTYGHLQGDKVLREVARVLRQSSREIDEPARYGGEEMAVALPQTDLEGAYQFAERVRRRIEALEIPVPGGNGALKVTASFGVASLGAAGDTDKDALVAAADGALYEAKRAGKNRTVRASGHARRRRDVHGVVSTE